MGSQGLDPGTCPPHWGGCCSYRLTEVGGWVSGCLQGGAGTDPYGGLPSTPRMCGQVGSGPPVRGWAGGGRHLPGWHLEPLQSLLPLGYWEDHLPQLPGCKESLV